MSESILYSAMFTVMLIVTVDALTVFVNSRLNFILTTVM